MNEWIANFRTFGLTYWKRYYSLYRGFVLKTDDPEKLGRITLKIPQVWGKEEHDYWAWPKGQMAGKDIGFFAIPNEGDMVWVMFEEGDPSKPVWEYGHWAKDQLKDNSNLYDSDKKPSRYRWLSTKGQMIEFNEKDDEESVTITDKNGNKYKSDKDGIILTDNQSNKIVMKKDFIGLVRAKNISLGQDGAAAEPSLLGDKWNDRMDDLWGQLDALCDAMSAMTVPTALGPSGTPINAAQFTAVKTQLSAIKQQLPQVKSQYVTLD